jgi:hypothetical protein
MAKITKANTSPLALYRIKDLPRGEYIRRVDLCPDCRGSGKFAIYTKTAHGPDCEFCKGSGYVKEYPTVWVKGDYMRSCLVAGKYELIRFDDISRCIYKPGNTLVLAGFTF